MLRRRYRDLALQEQGVGPTVPIHEGVHDREGAHQLRQGAQPRVRIVTRLPEALGVGLQDPLEGLSGLRAKLAYFFF